MPEDLSKLSEYTKYEFKDRSLLKEALTHTSYASEHRLPYNYQRLEFLGDTVLDIVVSDYIYHKLPEFPEGKLTKIRAAMVNQQSVAAMGRKLQLDKFILFGRGAQLRGSTVPGSCLGDGFEALLGAVYLDGGLEAAKALVLEALGELADDPGSLLLHSNPKGALQEFSQLMWKVKPCYETLKKLGPDHQCVFRCRVSVGDFFADGEGTSIHAAESAAAARLIKDLSERYPAVLDFD